MPIHPCRTIAAALTLCSLAHAGGLQNGWKSFRDPTIQDHGYEWAEVGHAGNADWVGFHPSNPFSIVRAGGVDHRYRIAKTEVSNRQYFEFVQAYAPYIAPGTGSSSQFTGTGILVGSGGGYVLPPQTADRAAEVGWRYAARYVNWLHNNKVNEAWAFESGVYDTTTFGPFTGGFPVITDQRERSEGARYFLPTQDEWIKAVHFDPDRFGEGQEGYWLYTYSSNTLPVAGAPGTPGAQTNAGAGIYVPVGSYPDAETPWGLLDASGGAYEWLENISADGRARLWDSSDPSNSTLFNDFDRISSFDGGSPTRLIGIRLASVVPGPGTSMLALMAVLVGRTRRR